MKLYPLLLTLLPLGTFAKQVSAPNIDDNTAEKNTVDIITFFNKGESYNYAIFENTWKINKTDTIRNTQATTYATLTVVDSTKNGYTMEWKFTGTETDTTIHTMEQQLLNNVNVKFQEKIKGQCVRFSISPEGMIQKWLNKKEVTKNAKKIYDTTIKEMENLPVMDSLKKYNVNILKALKSPSGDELFEGFVKELTEMFQFHGKQYKICDTTTHVDRTENQLEEDVELSIHYNKEPEGSYSFVLNDVNTVPAEMVKQLFGVGMEMLDLSKIIDKNENAKSAIDEVLKKDMKITNYTEINYYADGWPMEMVIQKKNIIDGMGKVEQKEVIMTE